MLEALGLVPGNEREAVVLPADDLVLLERHPDQLGAAALAAALAVEAERLDAVDGAAAGGVAVERVDALVHLADERLVPGLPLEALLHARILARVRGVARAPHPKGAVQAFLAFSVDVPWHLPTNPILPLNDFVAAA